METKITTIVRTTIILLLLAGGITIGKAQTHEFAPIGAEWYYSFQGHWIEGYVRIVSTTDTIINGINCRKLEKRRHSYSYEFEVYYEWYLGSEFVAQMGDSILLYRNSRFYTLFDFDAKVGDTWIIPGTIEDCDESYGITHVVGTGVEEIEGQSLKYVLVLDDPESSWGYGNSLMHVSNPDTIKIMECVGPIGSYLFPEQRCDFDYTEGGPLRCYSDDEIGLISYYNGNCDYINPAFQSCEEDSDKGLTVFPNPFQDQFTIHCDDETVQWVRVYDALGQLVLEKEWTENVTQINLSGYAPGVYHILLGGEQRYQSRIIRTQ